MTKGASLLSKVTFYRTYSRPQGNRMTTLEELAQTVADFSLSLGPSVPGEREALSSLITHRKAFPAGRTLWVAPVASQISGETHYNCAFHRIRGPKDFFDLQLLLMSGAGVGMRFTEDDLHALNRNIPLPSNLEVQVAGERGWVGYYSPSYTTETLYRTEYPRAYILVGDSREGWAEAWEVFFRLLGEGYREFVIDLSSVRPYGEPLRRFGGRASGPGPLVEALTALPGVLLREPVGYWSRTKVLDIVNLIGRATVAGGTRRSAEIALSDWSLDFVQAKVGPWWEKYPWRAQSNNTVLYDDPPSSEQLLEHLQMVLEYGEPGFANIRAAKARREDFEGLNPCAEILLRDHGVCNLATLVLPTFRPDRWEEALEAARLLTRHALRITEVPFHPRLGEWERVQREDRLVGISFTGLVDWMGQWGLTLYQALPYLERLREAVHREAREYSALMGVPTPRLATTVKPEGTLSLVAGGVSPGLHDPWAPYYIRRVRISPQDPVARALYMMGMGPHPEVGFSSLEDSPTWVFDFPMKSFTQRSAQNVPALEQLERYRAIMRTYVDHNASITVYVSPEEVEEVAWWLEAHWDDVVAVSFLPRTGGGYKLAPLEEISREEWEKMEASLPNPESLEAYISAIMEAGEWEESEVDPDCATGACPVK